MPAFIHHKAVVENGMTKALFLPGASGTQNFWRPVVTRLDWDCMCFSWPGLGDEAPHPDISCIDDLTSMVAQEGDQPVSLIAQSMGGYIALKLALLFPSLVRCLVLTVTSGGVPMRDLGGINWRPDYEAQFPQAAKWITEPVEDLSMQLGELHIPVLLIWGDADPISPITVGERLHSLLPNSRLKVIEGADHDLAETHAPLVADLIREHVMAAMGA